MTRSFHIYSLGLVALLLLAAPARAQLAVESVKTVAKTPPASPCRKVAARAFGQEICEEDIVISDPEQKEAVRQAYAQQGLNPDDAEKAEAMRKLETLIWDKALTRKFGSAKIEPTEAEIDTYRKAFREQLDSKQKDAAEISALVQKLLDENIYTNEDEATLREILNGNSKTIEFMKQREEQRKEMPPEFQKMTEEAERSIAEAVVKDWKRNKALFMEYGGRLALRNNRIEPVDASAKFYAWLQKEGKPVTLDAAYRDLFGSLKRFIKAPHDFIPEAQAEIYKEFYSSPDWILHFSQEKATLEKNREILLAVPPISKRLAKPESKPALKPTLKPEGPAPGGPAAKP